MRLRFPASCSHYANCPQRALIGAFQRYLQNKSMNLLCKLAPQPTWDKIKLRTPRMIATGICLTVTLSSNHHSLAQDIKIMREETSQEVNNPTLDADAIVSRTEAHLASLKERDRQIADLAQMVDELIGLLGETRSTNATRRGRIDTLSKQLVESEEVQRDIKHQLSSLEIERDQFAAQISNLQGIINDYTRTVELQESRLIHAKNETQSKDQELQRLRSSFNKLNLEVEFLKRIKASLTNNLKSVRTDNKLKSQQIIRLTQQLTESSWAKVILLARHRAELFSLLNEALGPQTNSRVVNNRFVFQSESLFTRGSSALTVQGRNQLAIFAEVFRNYSSAIPNDLAWVLRIDSHTDQYSSSNSEFQGSWDLSAARAIIVVKFLVDKGIQPQRLVAAGFGQYHPTDRRTDEIAQRRNRHVAISLTYP